MLTQSGDELLSKTSVLSEEIVEQRSKRARYRIDMSDEPGDYEEPELRQLLIRYLSQDMVTPMRIRNILIPLCLESERVTREDLKNEFVVRGESEDLSKAGYAQSVISSQFGLKKNDFLRQVIGYGLYIFLVNIQTHQGINGFIERVCLAVRVYCNRTIPPLSQPADRI